MKAIAFDLKVARSAAWTCRSLKKHYATAFAATALAFAALGGAGVLDESPSRPAGKSVTAAVARPAGGSLVHRPDVAPSLTFYLVDSEEQRAALEAREGQAGAVSINTRRYTEIVVVPTSDEEQKFQERFNDVHFAWSAAGSAPQLIDLRGH
jgi:hypothetical protein